MWNTPKYVEYRLERWADWNRRKNDNGLGYAKESTIYRMMHIGCLSKENNSNYSDHPAFTMPAEIEETETLIKQMWEANHKIADALRKFYLGNERTVGQKAKALGVSVSQFRVHVDMAKCWLAGRLSARFK